MDLIMRLVSIPLTLVGYILLIGWNLPKWFKMVTICNCRYRSGLKDC